MTSAEYQRKWRLSHPEAYRAYLKKYRKTHPHEIAAKRRAYYDAHSDEIKAKRRAKYNMTSGIKRARARAEKKAPQMPTSRLLPYLERQVAHHLSKGRSLADIAIWMSLPMSKVAAAAAKLQGGAK